MRRVIEKADILIEALPYLRAFRGKTFVIKYGGRALMSDKGKRAILQDIVFLSSVGIRPVLVHGGGPHIDAKMKEVGGRITFFEGKRVTDEKMVRIVDEVLTGINRELVGEIREDLKGHARGLNGKGGLFMVKPDQKRLGYVGQIVKVRRAMIEKLLKQATIPVVSPISRGRDGKRYNVNADEAATKLAEALRAEKLVFFSDVNGILKDRTDPKSLIKTVRVSEADSLISRRIVDQGMIPKLRSATHAIHKGVKKVHIISGSLPRALLLEIFTDQGIGTQVIR